MARHFEKINKEALLPQRATKNSAGYDFYLPQAISINPNEIKIVKTYIKAQMEDDEFLAIHIRSSLAIKKGLSLVNQTAIIDSDYYNNLDNDGHIMIALKNNSEKQINLKTNERFVQGVFMKYLTVDYDCVDSVRQGGIGSTK